MLQTRGLAAIYFGCKFILLQVEKGPRDSKDYLKET